LDTSVISLTLTEGVIRNPTFSVLLDMDRDGTFEIDISDDVDIDYIDSELEQRLKGQILGKPSANKASITLVNSTGRYSPNNPNNIESEYPGTFRRNTPIQIMAGFIDSAGVAKTKNLFTGVITDFKGNHRSDNRRMTLTLIDYSKFMKRKKNPNHTVSDGVTYEGILFNSTISDAVDYLVDYVLGTSYARTINPLLTIYPVIEFPKDQDVWATLQKLAESCDAKMYFEGEEFFFVTPLSASYVYPSTSQYTFTASNLFDFMELIEEDSIVNKFKITSNGKTVQPRQVVAANTTNNIATSFEEYGHDDGKSALGVDNKTITLKYWNGSSYINTINIPLVDVQTYSDLTPPITPEIEAAMNAASVIKVFDKATGTQLTIQDVVCGNSSTPASITLKDALNPATYHIQITYQHYNDRIIAGKYKWYTYDLSKLSTNIEYPTIEAHDGFDLVTYSTDTSSGNLYLSDWEILEGNTRVKFKLTNNVAAHYVGPIYTDIVYISRFEIFANPLECINPLVAEAIDATTIGEFENSYEINNDYIVDSTFAQQVTDYYLYRYKQEKSFLEANTKFFPQIELGDRVTVTETISGINFDFVVTGIKHSPKKNANWTTFLSLESLVAAWIYDGSSVTIQEPKYIPVINTTLSEIVITSNESVASVYENNLIYASVTLNFNSPASYNILDFLEAIVLYQQTVGGRYYYCGSFKDPYTTSFNVEKLQYNTNYIFYIVAIDKYNNRSVYGSGYSLSIGAYSGLPNVTNLSLFYPDGFLPTLKWSIIENIPNIKYEVRLGSTWATATFLGRTTNNQFTCIGSGTYWVSGYYNGYYSATPTSLSGITGAVAQNLIAEYDEFDTYWTGTKSSGVMVDYLNNLVMAGIGNFDDIPSLDAVTNLDTYGGVPASGTYEIPSDHIIDIGTPQTCIINGNFNLTSDATKTGAKIQIATSQDDVTYTDWADFIPSQYYARSFKFRLYLTSDTATTTILNSFYYYVDVPDIINGDQNITIDAAGTTINFSRSYNVNPSVVVQILSAVTGDYAVVSSITTTSFTVRLYNSSGTPISKNINWISQGY
jgi:hypothetical protein